MDPDAPYKVSGRGPEVIAVYSFFISLTTVLIAFRVFARQRIIKCFGLDDWTAFVGWFLFVLYGGFAIAAARYGTGQHAWLIPQNSMAQSYKFWGIGVPLYIISNMFVKLSIGLSLLRFVVERPHKLIIWATLGMTELCSLVIVFIAFFQCRPLTFFWTRIQGDKNGSCVGPQVTTGSLYAYSAVTCLADWIFALLPWLMVRKLQMDRGTKIMVTCVLAVGSIASTATIVRIPYIPGYGNEDDFLYTVTPVTLWSCIETGLSIGASSAATLKPLVRTWFPNLKGSNTSRQGASTTQPGPFFGHRCQRSKYIRRPSTEPRYREDFESDEWQLNLGMYKSPEPVYVRTKHG